MAVNIVFDHVDEEGISQLERELRRPGLHLTLRGHVTSRRSADGRLLVTLAEVEVEVCDPHDVDDDITSQLLR